MLILMIKNNLKRRNFLEIERIYANEYILILSSSSSLLTEILQCYLFVLICFDQLTTVDEKSVATLGVLGHNRERQICKTRISV